VKKLVGLLFLGACAVTVDQINPVVAEYNGDSVSIQLDGPLMEFSTPEVRAAAVKKADAEAARICRKGSRKRAEPTSSRNISTGRYTYVVERLYLCLN
jgi:hypothetical protein